MTSTTKDLTVADVIETMSKNEKKALYNLVSEIFNKKFNSSNVLAAALVITRMNDIKKRVAYFLVGYVLKPTKTAEAIENELKELLKS